MIDGQAAKDRLKEILLSQKHNYKQDWTTGEISVLSLKDGKVEVEKTKAEDYIKDTFQTFYQKPKEGAPERLNAYVVFGDRVDEGPIETKPEVKVKKEVTPSTEEKTPDLTTQKGASEEVTPQPVTRPLQPTTKHPIKQTQRLCQTMRRLSPHPSCLRV